MANKGSEQELYDILDKLTCEHLNVPENHECIVCPEYPECPLHKYAEIVTKLYSDPVMDMDYILPGTFEDLISKFRRWLRRFKE